MEPSQMYPSRSLVQGSGGEFVGFLHSDGVDHAVSEGATSSVTVAPGPVIRP
jgi:hypothetical protein